MIGGALLVHNFAELLEVAVRDAGGGGAAAPG